MNVFKELTLSVYDTKSYKEFLKNKPTKVFLAGMVLMVVYFLLTMVAPFMKFQIEYGGFANIIQEYVPDFELKDGVLWTEETFEYEEGGTYILIDTDPDFYFYNADEIEYYISDYYQVILMDSEKVIIKDKGQIQSAYFSDLGIDFTKENLFGFVPYAYLIVGAFLLIAFLFMTGAFFFGVLFVALLGMIAASCMKFQLTFGQLYLLGIYARTLPILIKAVLSYLPFTIPMFFVINFGISVLYLVLAIQKMRDQGLAVPLEFTSEQNNYFKD